jgi:hypothetical protein
MLDQEAKKVRHREYCKQRYQQDPEYRARVRASQRKYAAKPEAKAKRREQQAKRLADDEYRTKYNERHRIYESDPERKAKRAAYALHRQNDPVHMAKQLERGRKYRASPEGKINHKASKLKHTHGISYTQYTAMIEISQHRCPICGLPFNNSVKMLEPHVDHCHKTGKIRGILCRQCNLALGQFNDDPALLRRAIVYLKGSHHTIKHILD